MIVLCDVGWKSMASGIGSIVAMSPNVCCILPLAVQIKTFLSMTMPILSLHSVICLLLEGISISNMASVSRKETRCKASLDLLLSVVVLG
jgi:hypothetical protein